MEIPITIEDDEDVSPIPPKTKKLRKWKAPTSDASSSQPPKSVVVETMHPAPKKTDNSQPSDNVILEKIESDHSSPRAERPNVCFKNYAL